MGEVYGGAFLTISAALAGDTSIGFLAGQEHPAPDKKLSLQYQRNNEYTIDSKIDPLDLRAWTFQEKRLSPRLFIFSSMDRLWWDCMEGKRGRLRANWIPITKIWREHPSRIIVSWRFIVRAYSGLHLTMESDKLAALASMAAKFKELKLDSNDQYLAGCWKSTLMFDLLWRQNPGTEFPDSMPGASLKYRAPSWSWASLNGELDHFIFPQDDKDYQVDSEVVATYLDGVEGPSGEWLCLRGPLVKVYVGDKVKHLQGIARRQQREAELSRGTAWLDIRERETEIANLKNGKYAWREVRVASRTEAQNNESAHWCLLAVSRKGSFSPAYGLILRNLSGVSDGHYERIGCIRFDNFLRNDFPDSTRTKVFIM